MTKKNMSYNNVRAEKTAFNILKYLLEEKKATAYILQHTQEVSAMATLSYPKKPIDGMFYMLDCSEVTFPGNTCHFAVQLAAGMSAFEGNRSFISGNKVIVATRMAKSDFQNSLYATVLNMCERESHASMAGSRK